MKTYHVIARAICFRPKQSPLDRNLRCDLLFFLLSPFLLFSCTPVTQAASQTEVVTVYAAPAAEAWMSELFACANDVSVALKVSAQSPEIYLRVGEPGTLASPAYQIDEEEIVIATHRESPAQELSLAEAQALFAGQGDASVQVWVYASEADVQILFDQLVMKGRSVTSFARMAVSPQEMSDVLNSQSNAVGILPRHWIIGNVREVYSAGMAPVLAITQQEPRGGVSALIGCLQND